MKIWMLAPAPVQALLNLVFCALAVWAVFPILHDLWYLAGPAPAIQGLILWLDGVLVVATMFCAVRAAAATTRWAFRTHPEGR